MPKERRDVIFDLYETNAALARLADKYSGVIPKNLSTASIVEVAHTRDSTKLTHERKSRMLDLLKETPKEEGVVFRAAKKTGIMGEKAFVFFVPDAVTLEALLGACKRTEVILPKRARKIIIAEDLIVGLRFVLDDNALTFDE